MPNVRSVYVKKTLLELEELQYLLCYFVKHRPDVEHLCLRFDWLDSRNFPDPIEMRE